MIHIPSHPDYSRNQDKCKGDEYPCIVCGLPCPNPIWMVRVYLGTEAVTNDEMEKINAEEGSGGDLGMQPLGSACLKKHPELKPYAIRQG